jgi:uncharacterized protein (TIGR03066 family)
MKTKSPKAKNAGKQGQGDSAPVNAPSPRRLLGLKRWVAILLVIGIVTSVSFVAFSFLLPGRIPPELVGQWRVIEGPLEGMTIEFKRDGTMIGRAVIDGKEGEINGTVEVDGDTLHTTTKNPYTGKRETGSQRIVTLTETDLVTQDGKGKPVVMRRVR